MIPLTVVDLFLVLTNEIKGQNRPRSRSKLDARFAF